jgi:nitrite reductase/ring-hydroxylating ferredoxin subunit
MFFMKTSPMMVFGRMPMTGSAARVEPAGSPWHGADFDLKTGAVLGPPAQNGVPSYKVVVEGDDIKVEV